VVSIKETLQKEEKKDLARNSFPMAATTLAPGKTILRKALVPMNGTITPVMLVNGKKINTTVMV
jgi:hypothetical protein